MNKIFNLFGYILVFSAYLFFQPNIIAQRPEAYDHSNPIFLHGVASGDPTQSQVIIWTRVSLHLPPKMLKGTWEVASDVAFKNIVRSGEFTTSNDRDYTVKVDVDKLSPDTWYYYRFKFRDTYSQIGRTRTMPKGKSENIRIGVLSCQDYQNGYYNVLEDITRRNNLDIIFFLGDYIYEYGPHKRMERPHEPKHEILTLNDYRVRYSQYRLDAQLSEIHRQFPFICVWDDHETADNSYSEGAHNHDPKKEGDYKERMAAARQVYFEWLPVRENAEARNIYRSFNWGDLAKFYFLDTRLDGRVEQVHKLFPDVKSKPLGDTTRSLLGADQWKWLEKELKSSEGKWNFFAQQIMMAPLLYNLFEKYKVLNPDQWDGYPGERERLRRLWVKYTTPNPVVLTGDIHTAWANELPLPGYSPADESKTMGVEFVGSSVTSENAVNLPGVRAELKYMNPHIKFIDLEHHGYYTVDIRADSICVDYWFVNTIKSRDYKVFRPIGYVVKSGVSRLVEAKDTTEIFNRFPPLAPSERPAEIEYPEIVLLQVSGNHPGKNPNVWIYSKSFNVLELKFYNENLELIHREYDRVHNGFNEVRINKDFDISRTKKIEIYKANRKGNSELLKSFEI